MEEFGIYPSDEEAVKALRDLPAFQKDGKFDEAQAAQVEENLGAYGFRSADLLELMKYQIGFKKLKDLVTKNYAASPFAAGKGYAAMYQTIKGSTLEFKLEDFKKSVKVEDSEIQKAYDEKKDTFKTPEKRSIQWVLFEKPADLDKITDEGERKKKQADYTEKVRAFAEKTYQPGAKLADLAAAEKLKIEKAESFTQDAPPEPLKSASALVTAAFSLVPGATTITDPKEGEKGYYIAELTAREEPQQQDLASVKEQIRTTLVEQKAREAMATAVNDTREALTKGLKEGGKIEDLAKKRNLTLTALPEFSPNTPPPGLANAYDIAREAEAAAPNTLAKPVNTDTGVVLVYVSAKELRKQADGDAMKKSVEASATSKEQEQVFRAWFGRQKEAAEVKIQVPLT
jgi:peptidyl-prolyl cis-trans isomerase D